MNQSKSRLEWSDSELLQAMEDNSSGVWGRAETDYHILQTRFSQRQTEYSKTVARATLWIAIFAVVTGVLGIVSLVVAITK